MKRLWHEPLVHFLLIGSALFAFHSLTPAGSAAPVASREIRLSYDELSQFVVLFKSQWRREPTAEEFNRLVEDKIQAEILYREALAMGLDRNDEIVKRRMAQKMQFLAEDVAAAREPTSAQLRAWYEKNSAAFAQPPRVSFRQLYFSPDRAGLVRARMRLRRSRSSPASPRTRRSPHRSPIPSCSTTTTAIARRNSSARNSVRGSRGRSRPSLPPPGRGRWSPASAGTSSSSTP
jgi:hypothetical protein